VPLLLSLDPADIVAYGLQRRSRHCRGTRGSYAASSTHHDRVAAFDARHRHGRIAVNPTLPESTFRRSAAQSLARKPLEQESPADQLRTTAVAPMSRQRTDRVVLKQPGARIGLRSRQVRVAPIFSRGSGFCRARPDRMALWASPCTSRPDLAAGAAGLRSFARASIRFIIVEEKGRVHRTQVKAGPLRPARSAGSLGQARPAGRRPSTR